MLLQKTLPYLSRKSGLAKRYVTALLLFFTSLNCFAQQKGGYNLLWKISGNGLTKPSYLFGTMHVKDRKAFRFSDSVMVSIQKCSGFALEVHPDTMMKAIFSNMEQYDSTRVLKNLLTKEKYEKLAKHFADKHGFSIEQVNPFSVEAMLKPESKKADDKKTFVDAYLYGIARTLNKKISGLEDANEQVNQLYGSTNELKEKLENLLDADYNTAKESYEERMVDIYNAGNLDAVLEFINNDKNIDDDLISRNRVMVSSILKLMAGQNMFVAVGVAHLPGEKGLINLLKKEGYTLTPVNASFTGVADQYSIDYLKMNWETYTDNENGFSIETPGMAIKTEVMNGLQTVICPDLANDIYYGIYAIQKGTADNPVSTDELIKKVLNNYKQNPVNKIISTKRSIQNTLPVTDVIMQNGSGYLRLQLIVKNDFLYCLYIGNKLENLNQPYSNRFFNSFKAFKPAIADAKWVEYKNTAGAFKISYPVEPQPITQSIPNPKDSTKTLTITMYAAQDKAKMANYIVRYHDYPEGSYLSDRTEALEALVKDFSTKGKVFGKAVPVWKDGYEGREVKMMIQDKYYSEVRVYVRGNRMYFLLKQNTIEGSTTPIKDDFFNTFSFLPYQQPAEHVTFAPEGEGISIQFPSKPQIRRDSVIKNNSYVRNTVIALCTNPNSGGVYYFDFSRISNYFRTSSLDSLYSKCIRNLVGYRDSLISSDTVNMSGVKGREIISQNKTTGDKHRRRLLIDNGYMYILSCYLANEDINSPTTDAFFKSLTINRPKVDFDIYSSKSEKIARDLSSADTSVFNEAKGALSYYEFTKPELPVLYQIMQKNFPDDSLQYGVRDKLVRQLVNVNDEQSVKNLQNVFENPATKAELRATILSSIPDIDKKDGYNTYFKLLTASAPIKVEYGYKIFRPLYDSLEYASANFKQLLPLLKVPEYRKNILSLSSSMLYNKDKKYTDLIKANFTALTQYAATDLDNYLAIKDSLVAKWNSPVDSYLNLMQEVKGQQITGSFTSRLLKDDPKGDKISDACIARIKNHLPVDQRVLNKLMDSISTRYSIMKPLYEEKMTAKILPKYKKQDEFAKLCLYQNASDDEDEHPDKITLLGTVSDKGSVYYAFKFTTPNAEEQTNYIGIAGPFKLGSSQLYFDEKHAYTAWEAKKTNWQLQAKKLIPKLKKAAEATED
ncbi:TraB/GumN family protein [Mucilaginibacter sp. AW1-3]